MAGSFGGYWDQFDPHVEGPPSGTVPQSAGGAIGAAVGSAIPTPAPPTQQPQTVAPPGGGGGSDYQAIFDQLFPGSSLSPEQLAANEDKLKAAGFRLLGPNAAGQRSKIELPNGQIVDLIQGAGSGKNIKQWSVSGGGGASGVGNIPGFEVGMFTGGGQYPLSSVMGTGLAAPWTTPFNAPDPNSVTNDKALQWQMGRGMEAIQRSAAAKGTLLTGGTLKALDSFGQGLGSTYYNDVYNRKLGEYKMAHDIFTGNQDTLYDRLFKMGSIGENAAAGVGNAQLGMGDARAQGSLQQGQIWGNAASQAGTIAGGVFSGLNRPPQAGSTVAPSLGATSYVPGTYYPAGSFTP